MTDNELRRKVKRYKADQDITYKMLAEQLDISQRSIYNWLAGQYNFCEDRKRKLIEILEIDKGE